MGFPPATEALEDPEGLVAAGGALTLEWLVAAYSSGIFPWYNSDSEPILWWSPAERAVLKPGAMRVPRSLRKRLRNAGFSVSMDTDFEAVIRACAAPRPDAGGTWITPTMQQAYINLHHAGLAHSVETWLDGELVGGLYGVSIGSSFFGESMFSHTSDASKVAFYHLQKQLQAWHFNCIDCQLENPHLMTLGVTMVSREAFLSELNHNNQAQTRLGRWRLDAQ